MQQRLFELPARQLFGNIFQSLEIDVEQTAPGERTTQVERCLLGGCYDCYPLEPTDFPDVVDQRSQFLDDGHRLPSLPGGEAGAVRTRGWGRVAVKNRRRSSLELRELLRVLM